MKKIKFFAILCVLLASVVVFAACVKSSDNVYSVANVELAATSKNLINFDLHKDEVFQFRFEGNNKVTCSFIYFTAIPHEDGIYYYANKSNNVTAYRRNGGELIITGAIVGAGTLGIWIYGDTLYLYYYIDYDLIYTAEYKKHTW